MVVMHNFPVVSDCHLFIAKPLLKPLMIYCQFDTYEQIALTFDRNNLFDNTLEDVFCKNAHVSFDTNCSFFTLKVFFYFWYRPHLIGLKCSLLILV